MHIVFENQSIFVGQGGVQWKAELPTLVMLHGAGMDRTIWVLLGRYFARHGYNVVLPDLPGHGASQGALLNSIENQAQWLLRLLDHLSESYPLRLESMAFCGHSMGALTVMEAASMRVPKVAKLLLLGAAIPMRVGPPLLSAAQNNEHVAIDMINIYGHGFASQLGANPVAGISSFNSTEALLEQAADGVLFNDLNACHVYDNGEHAAGLLKGQCRSVVVAGDSDRMTPMKVARQCQHLLGAELALIPQCGHMMMSEQPEATLQAMRAILIDKTTK